MFFVVVILGCLVVTFCWREFDASSMPVRSPPFLFGNKTKNCVVWIRDKFSVIAASMTQCGLVSVVFDRLKMVLFLISFQSVGFLFVNFCCWFPAAHRSIYAGIHVMVNISLFTMRLQHCNADGRIYIMIIDHIGMWVPFWVLCSFRFVIDRP